VQKIVMGDKNCNKNEHNAVDNIICREPDRVDRDRVETRRQRELRQLLKETKKVKTKSRDKEGKDNYRRNKECRVEESRDNNTRRQRG
jgi:hypothetical protein